MTKRIALLAASFPLMLAACATGSDRRPSESAVATLKPTQGNQAAGSIRFEQYGNKARVIATVTGLKPGAAHGFHVHEKGDCSAADAMSAGGHFNPIGQPHGAHDKPPHHAGDMPNLTADATGTATLRWESEALSVGSGPTNVVGRSVIVHRDPDDYKTQPAGNAGPRLACGVIQGGSRG